VLCALQNVETQLELWENETRRVQQQQATYYSKFEDHELFNATLHTAQGHNSVLWFKQDPNPEGSFIVIKRSGEGVGSREGGISVLARQGRMAAVAVVQASRTVMVHCTRQAHIQQSEQLLLH
jgi:hypothetical protein